MYFDGNGNQIDIGTEVKSITTTVLGYDLPEDAGTAYGVSAEYAQAMKNAIVAWGASYAGDAEQVPFIVHTDQHGRLNSENKGVFDLLSYLVNWREVSAIFNLGDTVVDHWEDDNTNTNPLLRNATLEDALKCVESIPKDKQINVFGNHDTWYNGSVSTPIAGTLPSLQYINPYFIATGLRTERNPDNSGLMVVYDDVRRIKYLVLAAWDYADKPSGPTGYQWYYINRTHYRWIIDKMTENTGHDLVIVSHVPLMMYDTSAIDPITNESIARSNPVYIVHYSSSPNALWEARKNKTSGTYWDIPFDFTGCTDDLLCALAGHTHCDGVDRIGSPSLMQVCFDWFTDRTIHFGLLDRRDRKIKVWKLSNVDNTPAVENWEAVFDLT